MSRGDDLLEMLARGRTDHELFSRYFLGRGLHPGQLEAVESGVATINVLSTSNRWGKTFGLTHLHVFPFSPRPGTPAARMPHVGREIVKERARRLRERGEAALRRHLDAQIGATHRVLAERGGIGRTEHFTQVKLTPALEPGEIVDLTMTGHDGRQLFAA